MRIPEFNDVYKMSRILKKIDARNKMEITADMTQEQAGLQIMFTVVENLDLAQNEINEFMGSLTDMTGEEFGKLPLDECAKHINEFMALPGISNFFKLASQLMK